MRSAGFQPVHQVAVRIVLVTVMTVGGRGNGLVYLPSEKRRRKGE